MPVTRTVFTIVGLLLTPAALAGPPRPINVLVMHWYDRGYSPNDAFDRALQSALQAAAPEGIEYYSEYLETDRFPGEQQARLLSEYLRQKYAGKRLDVIFSGTGVTLDFFSSTGVSSFQASQSSSPQIGSSREALSRRSGPPDSFMAIHTQKL